MMNRKDFEKLTQAIQILSAFRDDEPEIYQATELLREIFNANGGAERYLFQKD